VSAAAAHDEQVGVLGGLQQCMCGVTGDGVHRHRGRLRELALELLDHVMDGVLGVPANALADLVEGDLRRSVERSPVLRRRERGDHLDRGAPACRVTQGVLKGCSAAG
jgi:hypothetical protein